MIDEVCCVERERLERADVDCIVSVVGLDWMIVWKMIVVGG